MRIWYKKFNNNNECEPCVLDYDSIIRWDNVILYTRQELYDICTECQSKEFCANMMKEVKEKFYKKK